MKSERRHQLERNELADRLGTGVAAVQPALPFILGGLAIVAVGSIAWGIYSSSTKQREAVAWTDFYFNLSDGDAEDFMDVADRFPTSTASGWARQTAGESYLAQGISELFENRAAGEEKIRLAIDAFENVLDRSPEDALRSKALIGLGQAYESLGQVDDAVGNYQQVLTTTSLPPRLLGDISDRVAFLTSESGKEFYDWFAKLDPKPDAAIDLGDLDVPPTLQDGGLQFGDLPDSEAGDSPIVPDLDLESLGLPDIDTPTEPGAASVDELDLPSSDNQPSAEIEPDSPDSNSSQTPEGSDNTPEGSDNSPQQTDSTAEPTAGSATSGDAGTTEDSSNATETEAGTGASEPGTGVDESNTDGA